uniref:Uncharacterized protein n=1 Tax=Arundo donax TaxID=35708 RepID=A0A0A9C7V1_ARUDO
MAGDVDTRKSTSRCIFFLGSSPISWYSLKQRVVCNTPVSNMAGPTPRWVDPTHPPTCLRFRPRFT